MFYNIHLHPCTKITLITLFSILIFIIDSLPVAAGLTAVFIVIRLIGVQPLAISRKRIRSWRNLSMLVIFLIILQVFFGPGGKFIVKPLFPASFPVFGGMGSLKWDGLILGLVIGCRLASLMILMSLFTETTSPHQIAMGLTSFGFNYRTAFVITACFNLIPVFEEEGRAVMDAQKLRGLHISGEEGSFFEKIKAYPGLAVPLVLGAMRKAQSAGTAMDSRAFGAYKNRTWTEKPSMKARDFLLLAACFLSAALALWLNYVIK